MDINIEDAIAGHDERYHVALVNEALATNDLRRARRLGRQYDAVAGSADGPTRLRRLAERLHGGRQAA